MEEKKRQTSNFPSIISPVNPLTIPLSYSPLENNYNSPKVLQSTSLATTPLSSNSSANSHLNIIHNYADMSGTSHFESPKQNNIFTSNLNTVFSANTNNNNNINHNVNINHDNAQKEINNLLQRVNELTIERGELSAKVYKQEYRDWETDRKSTRLNSSHSGESRMPSSA